jgi:hypothetical protein
MKKFSRKSALLFVGAMAACAFVMPSMASAASWGVIGTEHTLHSPNFSYAVAATGTNSSCGESTLTLDVVSAAVIEITSVSFRRCTLTSPAVGSCTQTSTATGLPWTATAVTTTNLQIHGIRIDTLLENHPGSTACNAVGINILLTGTLTGGRWSGNGANQHELLLTNAEGVQSHSALGNGQVVTLNGTFRDTQQTLTVTG